MSAVLLALFQIQLGSIDGRVLDPSGAAVRGARVSVHDGSRDRIAESDENGRFQFDSLAYGRYRLRVEAAGFETRWAIATAIDAARARGTGVVAAAAMRGIRGQRDALVAAARFAAARAHAADPIGDAGDRSVGEMKPQWHELTTLGRG